MADQEYSSGLSKGEATRTIEDTQVPSCDDRLVHLDNVRQLQLEILPIAEAQRRRSEERRVGKEC